MEASTEDDEDNQKKLPAKPRLPGSVLDVDRDTSEEDNNNTEEKKKDMSYTNLHFEMKQ